MSNQPGRAVLAHLQLIEEQSTTLSSSISSRMQPVGGGLFIHDDSTLIAYTSRMIYAFDLSQINEEITPQWRIHTSSSLRSVTTHQGDLWSVSEQGLRRFGWPESGSGLGSNVPSVKGIVLDLNQQSTLLSFPEPLLGESVLITANSRQVTHLSSESLRQVLNTPDLNPQRLMVVTRNTQD